MDHDTKVTLTVISILIIALGGIAFFLRGDSNESLTRTDAYSTETRETSSQNGTQQQTSSTTPMNTDTPTIPEKITSATITTSKGVIEVSFADNTPVTVQNFAKLAASGFYDGTRFHRVIKDFMIQGGDPLSKDETMKARWGTGGPGYTFQDETSPNDKFVQGVLAMANAGPNTNGSQFFIVTAEAGTPWLAGKHTIFGRVTRGMDVVLAIEGAATDAADRPLEDVIIQKVEVK